MLLPYISDYLYLQNTETVLFPYLRLIHFFRIELWLMHYVMQPSYQDFHACTCILVAGL